MKNIIITSIVLFSIGLLSVSELNAQKLQYFRPNGVEGLSIFETPKESQNEFDGLKVWVGGAYALQFQGITQENAAGNLVDLGKNFNLGTGNLDLNVQLEDGVRMHMRTFLSSRHHNEAWVKDGYIQIDKLDFIREGFARALMEKVTIKIGHMEINYGDTHFRRSDNGQALYNPFVGNFLMDSYTTEVAGEVYVQHKGLIAMLGVSNGRLNQSVTNVATKPALYGKLGFDRQINSDLRLRLTGSAYTTSNTNRTYLYGGDRAGSRYYNILQVEGADGSDFAGRINPSMNSQLTAVVINPFIKYKGLEFLGVIENASGRTESADESFTGNRNWTQLGAELLYRFGSREQLYIGARYNNASGQLPGEASEKVSVDRLNLGAGWYLTRNILTKIEYVSQNYKDYPTQMTENGAKFNGINLEAVVAF